MGILIDNNTKLLVQGITGSQGQLHTRGCRDYGTNIVAGVTPEKAVRILKESRFSIPSRRP